MTDYVPHTERDRKDMLQKIGVDSVESLFEDIPAELRFPELELPAACNERVLGERISSFAARNSLIDVSHRFIGAGSYYHHIPAIVADMLSRSEFYTSYTPYQPELSQGMLQATFEYQTMICRLTGMDISTASHYDGATALAEAVLMALRITHKPNAKVLVSHGVNPDMRAVVETYLQGAAAVSLGTLQESVNKESVCQPDQDTAAVVVQQPDFFGNMRALQEAAKAAHAAGALFIVVVDPLSLALFQPPSEYGADIVVAEGQSFGMPPAFGGPGLGILATQKQYARQLAGRLVGETVDNKGVRGYVLTLATREQHIRRAAATSNICTNAALSALCAAVYLSTLGKAGMRELANVCYQRSHYAAASLARIPRLGVNPGNDSAVYFREFIVELPISAKSVNEQLLDKFNIIGGYDLSEAYPEMTNRMLLAFTDVNTRESIDDLVTALERITSV